MKKLTMLLLAALLSGCGAAGDTDRASQASPSDPPSPMPSIFSLPSSKEGQNLQNRVVEVWPEIRERHSVELRFALTENDVVHLNVRSFGDFERELTQEDREAIRESLYELIGEEFKVEIAVEGCCDGPPAVTGIVKQFDADTGRVLIVNEDKMIGDSEMPDAYWIGLASDGKVFAEDEEPVDVLDASLVGKQAQVWTTGMVNQSYPAQTSAIKIVVE
ncbi:hypothetical protein [Cohnella cellulosilytica]|uniref:Lipoprotein n=1 Tax=Cohnella cellulosilytica TaxID=986710 RepID=A0ABW2FCL9_9BACL